MQEQAFGYAEYAKNYAWILIWTSREYLVYLLFIIQLPSAFLHLLSMCLGRIVETRRTFEHDILIDRKDLPGRAPGEKVVCRERLKRRP
jgi:hypothetical protein